MAATRHATSGATMRYQHAAADCLMERPLVATAASKHSLTAWVSWFSTASRLRERYLI
jgi:hypothetical protein